MFGVVMKKRRKNQGIITVFVTLIMVPTVVITGTMVDLARLKMCSSQAAMAADAYGEVVLSEYDNLLKELYGLFAVTQSKEGIQAIKDLAEYTNYSFSPDGDGQSFGDVFMPYKSSESKVTYENVVDATLGNNNVLMTQISDFMKFRVVEEVLEGSNVLNVLDAFGDVSADMDAVKTREEITTECKKALEELESYYQTLKKINYYPSYISEREEKFKDYSKALTEVFENDEYDAYVYYLENKEDIDDAKEKVEAYEEYLEALEKAEEGEEIETVDEPTNAEKVLAEKYVDVEEYKETLTTKFNGWPDKASNTTEIVKFGDIKGLVKELENITAQIEATLLKLQEKVEALQKKLPECSEAVRDGIKEELKDLEDIVDMAGSFAYTTTLLKTTYDIAKQDEENKEHWEDEIDILEAVQKDLIKGEKKEKNWANTIQFEFYSFQTDSEAAKLYSDLASLCETAKSDGTKADKDAGDKEIKKADDKRAKAEEEISGDEKTEARNIDNALTLQLGSTADDGEVPGVMECFSGEGLVGNCLIDKFLVVTYDFGMFSSRVSGIEPAGETNDTPIEENEQDSEASTEEYYDESLTKIKMSKDVNYLYGAEIEYLIGGHNNSVKNLNHSRNIICGTRFALNYASSYSINTINSAINAVADMAAGAVTATVVGAPAAPLVRVAVSGALRAAFSMMETAADWKDLKERESVCLYKKKLDDLSIGLDDLIGLFGEKYEKKEDTSVDNDEKTDIKLSYEDYTYAIMCLFTSSNNILDRTANLITLNVNQAQQKTETLTTLNFKMTNAVTAVKSTCEVKFDFVIVPDNFLDLFVPKGTTKDTMQKLENGSYGYTVIRSY